MQLDEVLTMSARMAAATGNTRWEARYHEFEPKLDDAIKEMLQLAPQASIGAGTTSTDAANQALVEMEHRAFDRVRAGDAPGAQQLIARDERGCYIPRSDILAKRRGDLRRQVGRRSEVRVLIGQNGSQELVVLKF